MAEAEELNRDPAPDAPPAPDKDGEISGEADGEAGGAPGPGAIPAPEVLDPRVEAVLIATDKALSPGRLAEVLELPGSRPVKEAVARLNARYAEGGRSFRIRELAGGYQILTEPEHGEVVARLHRSRSASKLTPAQMETLAIIAYRQPVLRTDVEAIRGAASGEVIRGLMERRLVKIVGRAEELGRPMLYGTTRGFLEAFGLSSLKDLPKIEELAGGKPAGGGPAKAKASPGGDDPTTTAAADAAAAEADADADATKASEAAKASAAAEASEAAGATEP